MTTFHEDNSGEGGAIYGNDNGGVSVTRSSFSDDTASSGSGGAMYEAESSSIAVGDSTFTDDKSNGEGGAIYTGSATLLLSRSTFTGGSASKGGALVIDSPTPSSITTSTFTFNHAGETGGAIYRFSGGLDRHRQHAQRKQRRRHRWRDRRRRGGTLRTHKRHPRKQRGHRRRWRSLSRRRGRPTPGDASNDTIARNIAPAGEGGGISNLADAVSIENTIVVENTGGDCQSHANAADHGGNLDSDRSCFSEAAPDNHLDVEHPEVGALADNGGPTQTDELEGASAAIGGGVPLTCSAADQRGVPVSTSHVIRRLSVGPYIAPTAPTVTTGGSSAVTPTSAILHGAVNPNGPELDRL